MKKILSLVLTAALVVSICAIGAAPVFALSTTVTTNTVLGSGVPAEGLNYKNGNYEFNISYESPDSMNTIYENGTVKMVDTTTALRHDVYSQIKYSADVFSAGKLRFDFDLSFVGSPYKLYMSVYDKDLVQYKKFELNWNNADAIKWRGDGNREFKTDGSVVYKISYTIDLLTGSYSGTVSDGTTLTLDTSKQINDISGGVGMVELQWDAGAQNSAIVLHGAAVTELAKYSFADHQTLVDGVPSGFNSYNGVTIGTTTAGTGSVKIEDGKVIISGATDNNNYARLNFKNNVGKNDNGQSIFIELFCSASRSLTSATALKFNSKDKNGAWTITGGSLGPSNITDTSKIYRLGVWLDFELNRYVLYRDRTYIGEAKLTTENGISDIWLEYYDPDSAVLTINDMKYMVLEPSNYDAETNTYYTTDVMLLNGIPHYNGNTKWTQNGITFEVSQSGSATLTKLDSCDGIKFTNSNSDKSDETDDYTRLTITADVSAEKYPEGVLYARWDINIEGSESQPVAVCSKYGSEWPINISANLNPGSHTVEFVYNPVTSYYKVYFDGEATAATKYTKDLIQNIYVEWHGMKSTDVLILKNARFMNIKSGDFDSIGTIEIANDGKSANVNVHIAEKFGFISGDAVLIIAAYTNESELTAVNTNKVTLIKGDNAINVKLDDLNGGTTVKAFLWNSTDDVKPMTESKNK